MLPELYDLFLDLPRSIFANLLSRRLPNYGNVNEKILWKDLRLKTFANILALNAFAHHDLITLPLGINQTITTETLDMVEDATSRLPVVGNIFNFVIKGFHNLFFGKSPSGFKKGGVDDRMKYYGSSMVGLMSKEMYNFYTGSYYKSLSAEAKGIIPFNAFQDQGNEPLSTLLSATSNSTVLNFKLTDLVEAGVYDTKNTNPTPGGDRVEIVSTVHIAQFPSKDKTIADDPKNPQVYDYR